MSNTRSVPLRAAALCACLLSSALLTGCGGSSSSSSTTLPVTTNADGSVSSTPRSSNGLQFTLTANKSSYAVGEIVRLTLAIKNTSTQPVTVAASNYTAQDVLFQALQNNQVVGTSAQGGDAVISPAASPTYTVSAGQTLTQSGFWFQASDATDQQVAPGTYTLRGYLTTANINGVGFTKEQAQANLASNSLPITIHN